MPGRRGFLKNAGIGSAAVMLAPWKNHLGSENSDSFFREGGLDLTDPANAETLAQWGYLNVLAYGADPKGLKDSTEAIQNAIYDSTVQGRGVLVPSGIYILSDTLRCYKTWAIRNNNTNDPITPKPRNCFIIMGDPGSKKRPVFKLSSNAKQFDDVANPLPIIAFANFQGDKIWTREELNALNPIQVPVGVSSPPGGIVNRCMAVFDDYLGGIDFDCSGHPGSVGIFFPSAQKASLINVKVNAQNAHTGIWGIPGRNSGAMNIEVNGGLIGLHTTRALAGTTIVGLTLTGQTESAFVSEDFVPACIVGFHIKKKTSPVITISGQPYDIHGGTEMMTAKGTMALIDGMIEVDEENKAEIIDNKAAKSFYARNVYLKGSGKFIQSGAQEAVAGTGDWYQIHEYCYTDQRVPNDDPPYETNDILFPVYNVINGVTDRNPEPSIVIKNNSKPPSDLIRKHLYTNIPYPSFSDTSKTRNVMQSPYNAVPDERDNWEAIQQAIDDAEKDGGVVYVPKGMFFISKTLTLRSKTKLIGLGCQRHLPPYLTVISAHSSWQKIPGNEALIKTRQR